MIKVKLRIANITDLDDASREKGRYLIRINAVVRVFRLNIGEKMELSYLLRQGKQFFGLLKTSLVTAIDENEYGFCITTENSKYYLEYVNEINKERGMSLC